MATQKVTMILMLRLTASGGIHSCLAGLFSRWPNSRTVGYRHTARYNRFHAHCSLNAVTVIVTCNSICEPLGYVGGLVDCSNFGYVCRRVAGGERLQFGRSVSDSVIFAGVLAERALNGKKRCYVKIGLFEGALLKCSGCCLPACYKDVLLLLFCRCVHAIHGLHRFLAMLSRSNVAVSLFCT
jgi:hypothetical protein